LLSHPRTVPLDIAGLNLCVLHHKFALVALSPLYLTTSASQDIWDSHTKDSESIISLVKAEVNSATKASGQHGPIFTFEMGIILPVHTIG
jgi:hypothetical protein